MADDWQSVWEHLWNPQRMAYIKGEGKPSHTGEGQDCPFCRAPGAPADEGLVVARGERVYALLNLYPYNPGHLMVCPFRHVSDYTDLDAAEVSELGDFTQQAMVALRALSDAHGFNIGMNQGHVAGAGIVGHLHQHVVPRWGGDTNFLPVIGGAKAMPELLVDTRSLLERVWPG